MCACGGGGGVCMWWDVCVNGCGVGCECVWGGVYMCGGGVCVVVGVCAVVGCVWGDMCVVVVVGCVCVWYVIRGVAAAAVPQVFPEAWALLHFSY